MLLPPLKTYLDKKYLVLNKGASIDIPIKSHHYIENKQDKDLIIIETQLGSYFGEDDIERFEDDYGRTEILGADHLKQGDTVHKGQYQIEQNQIVLT